MPDYFEKPLNCWGEFIQKSLSLQHEWFHHDWVFRGQEQSKWSLRTRLERLLLESATPLAKAPQLEKNMLRDFRRHYDGSDRDSVVQEMLYGLALMQHHFGRTRLLDFSYSPFVAAFFAFEPFERDGNGQEKEDKMRAIWAVNSEWCEREAKKVAPILQSRAGDRHRGARTYLSHFDNTKDGGKGKAFVYPTNSFPLHERLIIQQGVFLCLGNVTVPFDCNLKALDGWNQSKHIVKYLLPATERWTALTHLHRMSINRATMFPGLGGLSQSLEQRINIYLK